MTDNEIDADQERDEVLSNTASVPSFARVWWQVSAMAIPMAISFTFTLQVMATGILAGRYDDDQEHRASITLMIATMNTVVSLASAPLFALGVVASKVMGEVNRVEADLQEGESLPYPLLRKYQQISAINRYGLIASALLSLPSFLSLFFSASIMQTIFNQDKAVSIIAQSFLRPYAFSVPGILLRTVYEQMMFVKGKTVAAMWMGLATFAVGTMLSAWLCFGGLGVKPLGYQGIAIGYVVESYLIASAYALYTRFHSAFKNFHLFRITGFDAEIKSMVKKAVNSQAVAFTFASANELLLDFLMGVFSGMIGTVAQAAMSFVMQFIYCIFLLMTALGISNQICVGKAVGAGNFTGASRIARYGVLTSLSWLLPPSLLVLAYPQVLRKMFGKTDKDIAKLVDTIARIMSVGVMFNAMRTTVLQQMRALKDTWASTIISALSLWAGLILSALLGTQSSLSASGVALGYTVGLICSAITLTMPRWWRYSESWAIQINARRDEPSFAKALRHSIFNCGPKQSELDAEAEESLLLAYVN